MDASLLEGLRVVDCSSFIAAPAAALMLADLGADVIKLEPLSGDPARALPNLPGTPKSDQPYSWMLDNRNKRGLALDLARPEGQAVVHRLATRADVFITNFPQPVRRKLAIDHPRLAALNERLIYASFTGYGETGPEATKPGFDVTAYWARSGLMDLVRPDAEAEPARSVAGLGDHPSGVSLFAAIMTGLYQRERTGRGTKVGSSLLANGLWANGFMVQAALCGAHFTPRPPRSQTLNALSCHYRCRDGRWLILALVSEARDWPAFARCMGREDLIEHPRYKHQADRFAHSTELITVFDEAFAERDRDDWRQRLDAAGLTFECVAEPADLPDDRQAIESGALLPVEGGTTLTVDSPFFVEGANKRRPGPAPALGEHSDAILGESGYSAEEIGRLRDAGVVA